MIVLFFFSMHIEVDTWGCFLPEVFTAGWHSTQHDHQPHTLLLPDEAARGGEISIKLVLTLNADDQCQQFFILLYFLKICVEMDEFRGKSTIHPVTHWALSFLPAFFCFFHPSIYFIITF